MLVAAILLVWFGGVSSVSDELLEPPLKNLKTTSHIKQSSTSNNSPTLDLPVHSLQLVSSCQVEVKECNNHEEDITCYGAKLPYSSSGPSLTNHSSESDWSGLSLVPGCWASVQPLLCAVFHPRCDQETRTTRLVPRSLCRAAVRPCRVLTSVLPQLPPFLDCDNDEIFSEGCEQDSRSERARFNLSTTCVAPLVQTRASSAYWSQVEECGLRCQSPLLTSSEYDSVHSFIAAGATLSLLCSLFAVMTFMVDWKGGSKYPARAIFYLNLCFVISNIGLLAQFSGDNVRDDIVCRADGVGRHQEPGQGENLSCVIIFVLVYFFTQSAAVWTMVLCYSWYVTFTWASQPNKVKEVLTKRAPYFHIAAWSMPLVFTIIILASNKVDGSYISGICFVGYNSALDRGLLVYLPLCCSLGLASFFAVKSVMLLLEILREVNRGVLPSEAGVKVHRTVIRIVVFGVVTVLAVVTAVSCQLYTVYHQDSWSQSLQQLVLCNIGQHLGEDTRSCSMENKPSMVMIQLELLTLFVSGVLCSSWVWTRTSVTSWFIALKNLITKQSRPVKLHKHELIAQAFAKRAELQAHGRLSLTFHR